MGLDRKTIPVGRLTPPDPHHSFKPMSSTITETPRTETSTQSVVNLTESAARHISSMLSDDPENAGKQLRVFVEAGGCSGLQYGMVFDERRDDDLTSEFQGVMVVVDPFSANYIRGAVIDFSEDLSGGGFKINNPNAQSSCGCGKSFHA